MAIEKRKFLSENTVSSSSSKLQLEEIMTIKTNMPNKNFTNYVCAIQIYSYKYFTDNRDYTKMFSPMSLLPILL